jgi:phage protein D
MNPNRFSTTNLKVEFPLSGGIPERAIRGTVEILETSSGHDVASIRYTGAIKNVEQRFRTGAPVKISWSNRYGKSEFVGYVHHTRPEYDADQIRVEIVCIGASFAFLSTNQRSWQDVTADLVIRQLAAENGFKAITEPHPRVYKNLQQEGISDWALMKRLSKDTGYPVNCNGVNLVSVSRKSYAEYYRPLAQSFLYHVDSDAGYKFSDVFSFRPSIGDYLPEMGTTNAERSVTAIDPYTGESLLLSGKLETGAANRAPFTTPAVRVSNTPSEAQAILSGNLENNRFAYQAKIEMVGSPEVHPEKQIHLRGVPNPYGGYWTVITVRHKFMSSAQYTMTVNVGSDTLSGDTSGPNADLSDERSSSAILRRIPEKLSNPLSTQPATGVVNTNQVITGRTGVALQYARWYADNTAA